MNIKITQINNNQIALIESDQIIIHETQDALDIMADATYQGASKIVLQAHHINPSFFDLKSGIAGDILQKFSTYRVQLAIVGNFSKYSSKSLKDFMFESNKVGHVNFVDSVEEAMERLTK